MRLTPSTFEWTGTSNSNWDNTTNWKETLVTNADTYPQSTTDEADFIAAGKNAPTVDADITVGSVMMKTGYAQKLTIGANHTLTMNGGLIASFADGEIGFQTGGILNLANIAANFSGTDIDSTGTGLGKIYVNNDAQLNFIKGPTTGLKLGASVLAGVDPKGVASTGYLQFATQDPTTKKPLDPLNGNVILYNNVNITVKSMGIMNFNQAVNSDTAGGIALDAKSGNSTITNGGTINRNFTDPKDVTVAAPVTTSGNSAALVVGAKAGINFAGKYDNRNGGTFTLMPTGRINGFIGNTGAMIIGDPGAGGSYVAYVEDNLLLNGATLQFNVTTPGATVTLAVAGDADITAGSATVANGNALAVTGNWNQSGGSVSETSAAISDAALTLSGGTLQLTQGSLTSTGNASVSGGSLLLGYNAAVAAVALQVAAGGVLSGAGTVNAAVTNAGEVDAGGAGYGNTLAVNGNYTQTAGVTNVGSSSQSGALNVSGLLDEQGGALNLYGSSTLQAGNGLQVDSGAALTAYGYITITGNVTDSGTITVGDGQNVGFGLSVTGNYTQTATGVLNLGIQNPYYQNTLSVSGQASLGGTLNVTQLGGSAPQPGNQHSLVHYGSRVGQFATVNLPYGNWTQTYDDVNDDFYITAQ